jgi:hypothetical protein
MHTRTFCVNTAQEYVHRAAHVLLRSRSRAGELLASCPRIRLVQADFRRLDINKLGVPFYLQLY